MFTSIKNYFRQRREQRLKMKILKYAAQYQAGYNGPDNFNYLPSVFDSLYRQITGKPLISSKD